MPGCNPLLRDPNGNLWSLGVLDAGMLTTTPFTQSVKVQNNPILSEISGQRINWQLSANINGNIVTSRASNLPTIRRDNLSYIPLLSPGGVSYILQARSGGFLQTVSTNTLFPDIIPYIPNVQMSIFGAPPVVTCPVCANAIVTVSGDLSCWCCECSAFVLPEDTTITVVLEE